MLTFVDLFNFLIGCASLINWLAEHWDGKDKQESVLRLFVYLGLCDAFDDYVVCTGNFNKQTIKPATRRELFYNGKTPINLKDSGDASDLTLMKKDDNKCLFITTSKNKNKYTVGDLDIEKLETYFEQYKKQGYSRKVCICVRDKKAFYDMVKKSHDTSKVVADIIQTAVVIDWNDLDHMFVKFKQMTKFSLSDLLSDKTFLILKPHQQYTVAKTSERVKAGTKELLWGHIQRSGKSYMLVGSIIDDANTKDACNYLVMSTYPKETISQYLDLMNNTTQLNGFTVMKLDGKMTKPKLGKKNIFVCSSQFLRNHVDDDKLATKTQKICKKPVTWLKNIKFDMRFIDESHNGGSTDLSKLVLNTYGSNAVTVHVTATYMKPMVHYSIPIEDRITWDLEDVTMCKKFHKYSEKLYEKHPGLKKYMDNMTVEEVESEYASYPAMHILTQEIKDDVVNDVIETYKDEHYGWSTKAAFLLKTDTNGNVKPEFQDASRVLELMYDIFGKYDRRGALRNKRTPFMKRVETICDEENTRFMGDGKTASVTMMFLPTNHINIISHAVKKILEDHDVVPNYDIVITNSENTSDAKKLIDDAVVAAGHHGKKHVLVLSGTQCSTGVTINNCDVVILLNNISSYDMIQQMSFRCMTPGNNKKCAFVIDLNIHRQITHLMEYANMVKPDENYKTAIRYILKQHIININHDEWLATKRDNDHIQAVADKIYRIFVSFNSCGGIESIINKIILKNDLFTKENRVIFNTIFKDIKSLTSPQKKQIQKVIDENTSPKKEEMPKGIEKKLIVNDEVADEPRKNSMTIEEMVKFIVPLMCMLTIHDDKACTLEAMWEIVNGDEYITEVFIAQLQIVWNDRVDIEKVKTFFKICIQSNVDSVIRKHIEAIKEMFTMNITNTHALSDIIDKYLVPHENEKKSNAEVSTPKELRKEMLDKIPSDFWKTPKKVFEPCCGKGGFVIDIVSRFKDGLSIKDEQEKYRVILEECLHFADINPLNIYITKLLIDPLGKYKLNCHEGDTLKMGDKWGKFDAVIGNPPYNSSGNVGTGNAIWQHFVKMALNVLKRDGYLSFVHPGGWRKPVSDKSKYKAMFELMTHENHMLFLSIHGIKDGQKTFKCGTRYDWYVIQNKKSRGLTTVVDELGQAYELNMSDWNFLPNYNFELMNKLLAKNGKQCQVIYGRSNYGADKKHTSSKKTDTYRYPLIHSTPLAGTRYYYSSTNENGHFGVSKIIFGESGIHNAIIDVDGKYGMTQCAMAIGTENLEEGEKIKKAIESGEFKELLNSCSWSNFRIDWLMFKYFKKDFWKHFI